MKMKTTALATPGDSATEEPTRERNSSSKHERIRAFLVTAILLGIAVTIFAPRLHSFVASVFTSLAH